MIKKGIFIGTAVMIVLICVISSLSYVQYSEWKQKNDEPIISIPNTTRSVAVETKEFHSSAVIGGIGDILIHDWVYNDAKIKNGYNFKPIFHLVKPMLQKPDLLIANQESIPGGEELGISSYPSFNSPYEIVDAIMDAGVDFVNTANNHALDKGEKGIQNALSYYDKVHLPHVGTFKNEKDHDTLRIETVNGIKIAILGYTYGTNGIPVPKGKDYLVNTIDEDKILSELKRAREAADLVILNLHWGIEYTLQPNEEQKRLAKLFTNGGADVILGHHPHVLEPIEKIHTSDGRDALVIYSLGNFISGQMHDFKDIGGMIDFNVSKSVTAKGKEVKINGIQFHPTYVYNKDLHHYLIYPLDEANKKGLIDHSYKDIMNHMMNGLK